MQMIHSKYLFAAGALVTGLHVGAAESKAAKLMAVEASRVFIPEGFDDNDNVEVILDGYLPSGCYKLTRPEVKVDAAAMKITIEPMARFFDTPCIEARVPYTYEVQLGILPKGRFEVVTNAGRLKEKMDVGEATNAGPDDHVYAPVDSVEVHPKVPGSRARVAILEGRFTNTCMSFDTVQVIDSGATLQVLPIIKMETRDDCEAMEFPFRRVVDLPEAMSAGRHLLHVRSLNGQAINFVFSVTGS